MAFPPPTQVTNVTDATEQAVLHPQLHNANGAAINDLTAHGQYLETYIGNVNGRVSEIDGRLTNADAALDTRVDATEASIVTLDNAVSDLRNDAARLGAIRGRTNVDAVADGGSVRYTQDLGTWGVVDTGDGSGYTVPTGVYGVSASTIPDGGDDMTCYINIGGRSVAVGSRLIGDGATYATWVGRVLDSEQISVHVRMPTPRAVIGGRLEIWRLAEST